MIWKGEGDTTVGDLRDHILPLHSSGWVFLDIKAKDPSTPWLIITKKKISKSQLQKEPETKFASAIFPKTEELRQALLDELLLGVDDPECTKLVISNRYEILELMIPEDPTLDARSKRLLTKRRGIIHRTITGKQKRVDIPEIKSDLKFEA